MSPWVPRVLILLGVTALVATVISISVGEGGPGAPAEIGGVNDVQRIFGGILQEGAVLGDADAPVSVEVFNDMQCAPCADFHLGTIDRLVEDAEVDGETRNYVRDGDIQLVFRHFSLAPNDTTVAAIAAEAAGVQEGRQTDDYQWQYIDTFFRNQDLARERGVTDGFLREIAETITPLELDEWDADFADPATAELVREDAMLAAELELPAQSAVVVSGPGGQRELIETPSYEQIVAAIEAVS